MSDGVRKKRSGLLRALELSGYESFTSTACTATDEGKII